MIRARHVTLRRAGRAVLDDVSLDAGAGEVVGLAGPNGAGKTALLRVLATLDEPTAGRVTVAGVDAVLDPAGARRHLAWLPSPSGRRDEATARDHLRLFAAATGAADAAVESALELADLGALAHRPVPMLSSGEYQRLRVARALLGDPRVLLLDDPAAGLDAASRDELWALVDELAALGRAVVVAAHDLDAVCARVVTLERGRVAAARAREEAAP